MSTIDTVTRAQAVKSAKTAFSAFVKAGKAEESATVLAVKAIHEAYAVGLLADKRGAGEMTQQKYVDDFFPGMSSTNVTYWRDLDRAMTAGVTPDSKDWATLTGKNAAHKKAVRDALRAEVVTPETVHAAILVNFTEQGEPRDNPNADAEAAKRRADKAAKEKRDAAAAMKAAPAEAAKNAVAVLRKVWPDLTTGQRKAILNGLAFTGEAVVTPIAKTA